MDPTTGRRAFPRIDAKWIFCLAFVACCALYEYGRILHERPLPHHLMRQTMSLSVTWNYYDGNTDLFQPEIHHLFNDGGTSGKSAAEFPLLYYIVGLLWRIIGPSEFAYRVLMLALHFAGSLALFTAIRRVAADGGWALLIALLFFTSPAIVYFAVGFITEVPALDLVWIAAYYLIRRWPDQARSDVVVAFVLITLAGLIKITSFMAPLAALVCLLGERFLPSVFPPSRSFFKHQRLTMWCYAASVLVIAAWHVYAVYYNGLHGSSYSHQGILPVWDLPPDRIAEINAFVRSVLVLELFDTSAWAAFLGMAIYLVVYARSVPRPLLVFNGVLLLGAAGYVMLWYEALHSHDYYFIHPMIALLAVAVTFVITLQRRHAHLFRSRWVRAFFVVLLLYNIVYAANDMEMRTRGPIPLNADRILPLYHAEQFRYWDLTQYWGMDHLFDIEPYDRSLGMKKEDRIICVQDGTLCAMLYFTGQHGWNEYMGGLDAERMRQHIAHGAKYLVVKDAEWLKKPFLQPYLNHPVGEHKGILIFRL